MALSGLQLDVLKLYRSLLKSARNKDPHLQKVVREEFRRKAGLVDGRDFKAIEHHLRWGYKQKKLMDMPGFTGASVVGNG